MYEDQEGLGPNRHIGIVDEISDINEGMNMRKQVAVLVLAVGMCSGLANGLTMAATPAPQDDKMQSQGKMKDEKMKDGKMTGDKMAKKSGKHTKDKMASGKMKDERMKKDKMEDNQ